MRQLAIKERKKTFRRKNELSEGRKNMTDYQQKKLKNEITQIKHYESLFRMTDLREPRRSSTK